MCACFLCIILMNCTKFTNETANFCIICKKLKKVKKIRKKVLTFRATDGIMYKSQRESDRQNSI